MKKLMIFVYAFFLCPSLWAQGEGNIWMADGLPFGGTGYGLRFTAGGPVTFDLGTDGLAGIRASQALCDSDGNPLFYTGGGSCKVYDRLGNVMSNGSGLQYPTAGTTYSIAPLIAAHPGNPERYYIFYQKNGNVYYSLVDMSLNSGLGDVVEKNISINGFSGPAALATTSKITLVQGCSGIWLVVRSKNAAQFRSYELRDTGLVKEPVISHEGNFPVSWYNGDVISGKLKATPDGLRLAATVSKFYNDLGNAYPQPKGGIELYDFEKCSGLLSNAMVIDSSQHYDGLALSPDNSKLYASSGTDVYQFDISLSSPADIMASRTFMLSNTTMPVWVIGCGYCDTFRRDITDLKLASDGKVYMGNNRTECFGCMPESLQNAYHSIEAPDVAGIAALPVTDAVLYPMGGYHIGLDLPPDIVTAPARPDTLMNAIDVTACFVDTLELQADSAARCILWDDGSNAPSRTVTTSGAYYVRYFKEDCSYHIDTFHVDLVPLPIITSAGYSCPGALQGSASIGHVSAADVRYNFNWKDAIGNSKRIVTAVSADTVSGLDTGLNYVQVTTAAGCDTTLSFYVTALPQPRVSFDADTAVCSGAPVLFRNISDAAVVAWDFGNGITYNDEQHTHVFGPAGAYEVALTVINAEGCTNTATTVIYVRELDLNLKADALIVDRGESVLLTTSAPEPYTVTAWEPAHLFPDESAIAQELKVSESQMVTVFAYSNNLGCKDSASIVIKPEPYMQVPNAFSPNGDGLNDRFFPLITGEGYALESFLVFNRWGQLVYEAYLNNGISGWDGSYNGKPADLGVYFYHIVLNNPSGKQVVKKGEVTLLR